MTNVEKCIDFVNLHSIYYVLVVSSFAKKYNVICSSYIVSTTYDKIIFNFYKLNENVRLNNINIILL